MNELAVSIGVILFPGLIASVICDKTAAHNAKWDGFKYGIYSFVFGVACYGLVQAAEFVLWQTCVLLSYIGVPVYTLPVLHVWSIITIHQADIRPIELLFATLVAPFVAAVATWTNNEKLLNKVFQRLGISSKYGDENLFSHYLAQSNVCWVYVRDVSTNQTYQGWVSAYSETDHIQEIVLSNVTVYDYKSSEMLYVLSSIYLSKPAGTFAIEQIPESQWSKENAETATD